MAFFSKAVKPRSAVTRTILRCEQLESRRLLATFEVGQIAIDTESMVSPGPGQPAVHSLRSAIKAANDTPGHDIIVIPSTFSNQVISLSLGTLNVTSSMDILGPDTSNPSIFVTRSTAPSVERYGLYYNYTGTEQFGVEVRGVSFSGFTSAIKVDAMPSAQPLVLRNLRLNSSRGIGAQGGHGLDFSSNNQLQIINSRAEYNQSEGIYIHDTTSIQPVAFIAASVSRENGSAGITLKNANRPFYISGNTTTRDNGVSGGGRGGIWIEDSSSTAYSEIGDGTPSGGHVSRTNRGHGIAIINSNFPNLKIQSNYIGVFSNSGTSQPDDQGNDSTGIYIVGSTVGPISGNQIGFSGNAGMEIRDSAVDVVQGNLIGSSASNLALGYKIGNAGAGIIVSGTTSNLNLISNTIANNGSAGIAITGSADRIQHISNSFLGNKGVAVDIGLDGITPNDTDDWDSGPNAKLNTPVLKQSTVAYNSTTGQWEVTMGLDVDSPGRYDYQLYRFDTVTKQYSVIDQGFLQSFSQVVAGEDAVFTIPIPGAASGFQYVAVLLGANQQGGNLRNQDRSSEFSEPITIGTLNPPRVTGFAVKSASQTINYVPIVAAGQQYLPVSLADLNAIQVTFDQAVVIGNGTAASGISALQLIRSGGAVVTPTGFAMSGNTATWTFSSSGTQSILDGKYALNLTAQSIRSVATNAALDGEYDAPIRQPISGGRLQPEFTAPTLQLRSGQGVTGGNFSFYFAVKNGSAPLEATRITGDYNDDEWVDRADYLVWRQLYASQNGIYFDYQTADFWWPDGNDDGLVNAADYTVWRDNAGTNPNIGLRGVWAASKPSSSTVAFAVGPTVLFDEAPRVSNVVISGSSSSHADFSFQSVDGTGQQLARVPVGGADTIRITFNEDVNAVATDLNLVGLLTGNHPDLVDFSYDIMTMTAEWRFQGWALGDHYAIHLSDSVTDLDGNRLDGEWVNPSSIGSTSLLISTFPSGNGSAGGDFTFVVTLLPGDVNGDGDVDYSDTYIFNYTMGWVGSHVNWAYGDFDGDGTVSQVDLSIANSNLGTALQSALAMLSDFDNDLDVDEEDLELFFAAYGLNDVAAGDVNGDSLLNADDLTLIYNQLGVRVFTDSNVGGYL